MMYLRNRIRDSIKGGKTPLRCQNPNDRSRVKIALIARLTVLAENLGSWLLPPSSSGTTSVHLTPRA